MTAPDTRTGAAAANERSTRVGVALATAAADVACVAGFAVTGRASHAEALDASGVLGTAWPFLAGLAAGWLTARAWRRPLAVGRVGMPVWAATVVGGMLLRAASGQGTAPSFVVVAALVLSVLLVGWRAAATLLRRLTSGRAAAS